MPIKIKTKSNELAKPVSNEISYLVKNARQVSPRKRPDVTTAAINIFSGFYHIQIDDTKYDEKIVKTNSII